MFEAVHEHEGERCWKMLLAPENGANNNCFVASLVCSCNIYNHNYNKIVKSDWLSTALISALIGQFNRTVRVMPK